MKTFSKLKPGEREKLLKHPQGKIDIVLDTDAFNEVDDQFAIAYAFLTPEKFNVRAVYAAPFFNARSNGPKDGMEKSYEEIFHILDFLKVDGKDLVFKGAESFMKSKYEAVSSAAVDDLLRKTQPYSKEHPLYVVAIGAITNIASAIVKDPSIIDKIVVVWLSGHAHDMGNTEEFNMQGDVIAAQIIFDCGVALVQLPCLGVVSQLYTTIEQLHEKLTGKSELGTYLAKIVEDYISGADKDKKVIWDVAALAWLINPLWVDTKLVNCPVITDGLTYKFDESRHMIRYAEKVDRVNILDDLFGKISDIE